MMEAAAVIDLEGNAILWHFPPGRSGGALPDSVGLWEFLNTNRDRISGVAHSHPGSGIPGPSYEDVTTFSAIERGLGRMFDWWIATSDGLALFRWKGPGVYTYAPHLITQSTEWVDKLREVSGYGVLTTQEKQT